MRFRLAILVYWWCGVCFQLCLNSIVTAKVKASWSSTSLAAEAGEFYADQYFHYLKNIIGPFNTEKEEFDAVINYAKTFDPFSEKLVSLAMAMRYYSPRVEFLRHLQQPINQSIILSACGSSIQLTDLKAIQSFIENERKCEKSFQSAENEHLFISPGEDSKYIVYLDIAKGGYHDSLELLENLAASLKFNFAVRPVAQSTSSKPLFLSGYGVELMIKSTEYKVSDDTNVTSTSNSENEFDETGTKLEDALFTGAKMEKVSEESLKDFGAKVAAVINSSENQFNILKRVSASLPLIASTISKHEADRGLSEKLFRMESGLESRNALWINGKAVNLDNFNSFTYLSYIVDAVKAYKAFTDLGLDSDASKSLVFLNDEQSNGENNDIAKEAFPVPRFKIPIERSIFLNNLEKDSRYLQWSSDWSSILQPRYPNQLIYARKNLATVIYVFDVSHQPSVQKVEDFVTFIQRRVPLRFGLMPTFTKPEHEIITKFIAFTYEKSGLKETIKLLKVLAAIKFEEDPRKLIEKKWGEKIDWKAVEETIDLPVSWKQVHQTFTSDSLPTMFFNGEKVDMMKDVMGNSPDGESYEIKTIRIYNRHISYLQMLLIRKTLDTSLDPLSILEDQPLNLLTRNSVYFDSSKKRYPFLRKENSIFKVKQQIIPYHNQLDSEIQESVWILWPKSCNVVDVVKEMAEKLNFRWAIFSETNSCQDGTVKRPFKSFLNLHESNTYIIINGHVIGPVEEETFTALEFEALVNYERSTFFQICRDASKTTLISDAYLLCSVYGNQDHGKSEFVDQKFFHDKRIKKHVNLPSFRVKGSDECLFCLELMVDPVSNVGQKLVGTIDGFLDVPGISVEVRLNPDPELKEIPVKRFYRYVIERQPTFDSSGSMKPVGAKFDDIPSEHLFTLGLDEIQAWVVMPVESIHDLDNIKFADLPEGSKISSIFELKNILVEGHCYNTFDNSPPRGLQFTLSSEQESHGTIVMANLGYFQLKANPGSWNLALREGRSNDLFELKGETNIMVDSYLGRLLHYPVTPKEGMENEPILVENEKKDSSGEKDGLWNRLWNSKDGKAKAEAKSETPADINIFSVASGHLYERFLRIMILSVLNHTKSTVKFWFIENFLSPIFKTTIPFMAKKYNFTYEMINYKWPAWLRKQPEKQRMIWAYKILFLDVLFPLDLNKVIFVDADQIVRTDLLELVKINLKGAPYGYTPFCSNKQEIEGFRFWKHGYWESHLRGKPYHISALYVVDLKRLRAIAGGDRLRGTYQMLSADPNSLSNLDQDLPNYMQHELPIFSLPQDWLWCETWCSSESLKTAKTIDLCNNPMTKEPKLERAQRLLPEWKDYDSEVKQFQDKIVQKLEAHPKSSIASLLDDHLEL